MASRTDAPRLRDVAPSDLEPGGADDLLPGDLLSGRALGDLDLTGRRCTDLEVEECTVGTLAADDTDLRGLRIRDTTIDVLDAAVFRAARTTRRGVRVHAGRVGSAELHEAELDGVVFTGMKLGFVDLRGSRLTDVVFRDCVIDELDLANARWRRVAFPGCTIRELGGAGAALEHVDLRDVRLEGVSRVGDLRGVTVDGDQVARLAPLLARAAGLVVED